MSVGLLTTRFEVAGEGAGEPWLLAQQAERLGFESLWAGEHHVVPGAQDSVNAYHGDNAPRTEGCLVRLAGVAAATKTIRIGTSILLVPQHHPVLLAKEIATLDQDSGGRLIVGIGVGWQRAEVEIMGGDWEHRASQTREAVEVMKKLWTGDFVDHDGRFYSYPTMLSRPTPQQRPHPPILLGMHTDKTPGRVAAYADGWLESVTDVSQLGGGGVDHIAECRRRLDEACRRVGRDPAEVALSVILNDGEGSVDRALVARYLDAGAVRIVLLGSRARGQAFDSDDEAVDWLERLAGRVLES